MYRLFHVHIYTYTYTHARTSCTPASGTQDRKKINYEVIMLEFPHLICHRACSSSNYIFVDEAWQFSTDETKSEKIKFSSQQPDNQWFLFRTSSDQVDKDAASGREVRWLLSSHPGLLHLTNLCWSCPVYWKLCTAFWLVKGQRTNKTSS